MKDKIIEKTEGGYTLRLSKGTRVVMGFVGVFFGMGDLLFLIIAAVAFLEGSFGQAIPGLLLTLVFFCTCVAVPVYHLGCGASGGSHGCVFFQKAGQRKAYSLGGRARLGCRLSGCQRRPNLLSVFCNRSFRACAMGKGQKAPHGQSKGGQYQRASQAASPAEKLGDDPLLSGMSGLPCAYVQGARGTRRPRSMRREMVW